LFLLYENYNAQGAFKQSGLADSFYQKQRLPLAAMAAAAMTASGINMNDQS
jgi:hypothetical protein